MAAPGMVEIAAVTIFAIALLHTFSTHYFQALAHAQPNHAGLWHLLGEVEVVFGFWAAVLLVFLVTHSGAAMPCTTRKAATSPSPPSYS